MEKHEIPLNVYEQFLAISSELLDVSRKITESCNKMLDFLTKCYTINND